MDFDTGKLMMFRFYKPMFMGELQMITVRQFTEGIINPT